MITLGGDSMEPLASRGDRLLIDIGERDPVPPGNFVVWDWSRSGSNTCLTPRSAPGEAQVRQPGVRRLRMPRRRNPHRRARRLGRAAALRCPAQTACSLQSASRILRGPGITTVNECLPHAIKFPGKRNAAVTFKMFLPAHVRGAAPPTRGDLEQGTARGHHQRRRVRHHRGMRCPQARAGPASRHGRPQ